MIEDFLLEFEENTSPCEYNNYRKYGETFFRLKKSEQNTIKIRKIISLNPLSVNKAAKFLCNLADKHDVILEGKAIPTIVGPSITKKDVFFYGLDKNRLIKWYKHYGGEIIAINENGSVLMKRKPKNENKN